MIRNEVSWILLKLRTPVFESNKVNKKPLYHYNKQCMCLDICVYTTYMYTDIYVVTYIIYIITKFKETKQLNKK